MAESAKSITKAAGGEGGPGEDGGLNPAVERLMHELEGYLAARAQRLLVGLGSGLGSATAKLTDAAQGQGPGLGRMALESGRKALGASGLGGKEVLRGAMSAGLGLVKDNVAGAVKGMAGKGRRGSRAGARPTVILESVDIGVPVREAYDQWTQFQEFSGFAKGVRGVSTSDDTTSDWKFKIFWSSRSWRAQVTEQVPDRRIAWTAEGAKGTAGGVVTFHPLGENLTRVLLLIEYHPKGLFEKTGNIWRAQGRRARLDLKHFARFVTVRGEATGGWRGEIQDGEVVVSHEDAVAEEEEADRAGEEQDLGPEDEDLYDDEAADDEALDDEEAEADDEAEDDEPMDDEAMADEDDEAGDEEARYEDEAEAGEAGEYEDEERR
ncbi:SRPBCC family protein [Streptomyces sp. HPF1205]|uniref:SRPBCC family protein n=1 Tax=Streptomyces sp. HPF1205 TaxID=2873262 RepID=UPI001CECBE31|nr:SRPBCC family protein [Streptomyces sp. HPF1205]